MPCPGVCSSPRSRDQTQYAASPHPVKARRRIATTAETIALVVGLKNSFTPVDLGQDGLHRRSPDEGLGVVVVGGHVCLDCRHEIRHAAEHATAQLFRREFAEPALHEVEPRRARGGGSAGAGPASLVQSVATTPANVADITQVPHLLHSAEMQVWADAGYTGVARRLEHRGRAIDWQVALRPGQRRCLAPGRAAAQAERHKHSIRAKVEHPFLYVKRHFAYTQVRYRGLAKNRTPMCLLFGLANLLLAERAAPA